MGYLHFRKPPYTAYGLAAAPLGMGGLDKCSIKVWKVCPAWLSHFSISHETSHLRRHIKKKHIKKKNTNCCVSMVFPGFPNRNIPCSWQLINIYQTYPKHPNIGDSTGSSVSFRWPCRGPAFCWIPQYYIKHVWKKNIAVPISFKHINIS